MQFMPGIALGLAEVGCLMAATSRMPFGVRLGQITIDTVAACFGMKDEDDNAEAQKVCNTLRIVGNEVGR